MHWAPELAAAPTVPSKSLTGPTATLGLFGNFRAGDHWYFGVNAGALGATISGITATIWVAVGEARYFIDNHWAFAGGWTINGFKISSDPDNDGPSSTWAAASSTPSRSSGSASSTPCIDSAVLHALILIAPLRGAMCFQHPPPTAGYFSAPIGLPRRARDGPPLPHPPLRHQSVQHIGVGLREGLGGGRRVALEEQDRHVDRVGKGAPHHELATVVCGPRQGQVLARGTLPAAPRSPARHRT